MRTITPEQINSTPTIVSTDTATNVEFHPDPSETREITRWQDLPVIPKNISQKAIEIFHMGENQNNRNNVFSIIGDCLSTPTYFLTNYDGQASNYKLGDFENLRQVIAAFQGSFSRESLAVGKGKY